MPISCALISSNLKSSAVMTIRTTVHFLPHLRSLATRHPCSYCDIQYESFLTSIYLQSIQRPGTGAVKSCVEAVKQRELYRFIVKLWQAHLISTQNSITDIILS
jgi:hypothetical protein